MEYEYKNEWKQLKREGKIREAAEVLYKEIALILLRAHNYYSDLKYDIEELFEIIDINYGYDLKGEIVPQMTEFDFLRMQAYGTNATFSEMDYEGEEYKQEDKLKMYIKIQKKLINLYKKRFE